eukprot:COSAG05_NODE_1074_length_5958_cov_5.368152_10_plen_166_part_00
MPCALRSTVRCVSSSQPKNNLNLLRPPTGRTSHGCPPAELVDAALPPPVPLAAHSSPLLQPGPSSFGHVVRRHPPPPVAQWLRHSPTLQKKAARNETVVASRKQAAPKALLRRSPDAGRGCRGGSRQSRDRRRRLYYTRRPKAAATSWLASEARHSQKRCWSSAD